MKNIFLFFFLLKKYNSFKKVMGGLRKIGQNSKDNPEQNS